MEFCSQTEVIGCCTRVHNSCIDVRLELTKGLRTGNKMIEVVLGIQMITPPVNSHNVTFQQLRNECRCQTCGHTSN